MTVAPGETRSLTKLFGGLTAVDSVDLTMDAKFHLQRHSSRYQQGRQLSIIASPVFTNRNQAIFFFTGNRWSVCLRIRLRIRGILANLPEYPPVRQHERHRKYPGRRAFPHPGFMGGSNSSHTTCGKRGKTSG